MYILPIGTINYKEFETIIFNVVYVPYDVIDSTQYRPMSLTTPSMFHAIYAS